MKKVIFTLALFGASTLAAAGYVKADPCSPPPCEPCAKCAQIWPTCGPSWIITPNGGPCVACGIDVHITAEFLYWTAREDFLEIANINKGSFEPFFNGENRISHTSQGHILNPDWNYRPGFRVGVGILYDHDGWDLYANYTWFRECNTEKSHIRKEGEILTPFHLFADEQTQYERVSGDWQLQFDVVDLELGRNFFISRFLKLRPHFGLKGTWQKQDFDVAGKGVNLATNQDFSGKGKNHADYWGIGVRGGLDTAWHFTRTTSIFGDLALSAQWMGYQVESKTYQTELEETFVLRDLGDDFHTVKPIIELILGVRWETWFCCERYHFGADFGWEFQWWSGANQFAIQELAGTTRDLYLQGFTLRTRIDF